MPCELLRRYDRQKRKIRLGSVLGVVTLLTISSMLACRDADATRGVENLKRERGMKPEGVLTVVRRLDLGTLPLNGRMELLVSVKNPTNRSIDVSGYEMKGAGVRVKPDTFSIDPGDTVPVTIDVTPEATRKPGIHEWDIAAKTSGGELAFRTTLMLIVKDNAIVRESAPPDPREP